MPRHADVVVLPSTWTLLTDPGDATITGVRLQNLGTLPVRVQATADSVTPPTSQGGALVLTLNGDRVFATDTLTSLFPGVTSPLHLWAFCSGLTEVAVSHA